MFVTGRFCRQKSKRHSKCFMLDYSKINSLIGHTRNWIKTSTFIEVIIFNFEIRNRPSNEEPQENSKWKYSKLHLQQLIYWIFKYFQDVHFIRCILPNNNKQEEHFEESLVLGQLKTSCTISYANFIRFGYSKSVKFEQLADVCRLVEKKWNKMDRAHFYSKVLLSLGFKLNEIKLGKEAIFFRTNKFSCLEKLFSDIKTFPNQLPIQMTRK